MGLIGDSFFGFLDWQTAKMEIYIPLLSFFSQRCDYRRSRVRCGYQRDLKDHRGRYSSRMLDRLRSRYALPLLLRLIVGPWTLPEGK